MRRFLVFEFLLAACSEKRPPPAPAVPAPSTAPAPESKPDDSVDHGTLRIVARGKPAGEETFRIATTPSGIEIVTRTKLRRGDLEVTIEGTLVTDDKFVPQSATVRHTSGDAKSEGKLERKDGVLQLIGDDGKPIVDQGPSDLYIDNLIVSHLTPLCSLAGTEEKELKLFPGTRLAVSGRRELEFDTRAGQRKLDVIGFLAPGKELVEILCDGKQLAVARQPSAAVMTTRAGYEEVAEILVESQDYKPKLPAGLVELERKVRSPVSGGADLGCSLMMPSERRSPLPAVVLVGAQGPHDRDEDTVGFGGFKAALLKHLAIALAHSGIASLRCDDRGVGQSSGTTATAVVGSLAADVAVLVAALRSEPGIDRQRVGIVGHAEGATLAQLVAAEDPTVSALVLLAPMGRSLDEVSLDQRDAEMRKLGVKDEIIRAEHKRMAVIYAAIRSGKPPPKDTPEETVASLAPMVPYLASHFRHDPAFTARKVKSAVLIAHGERDGQIAASEAKILRDLYKRAGDRNVTFKLYPGLNHVFTPVRKDTAEDLADPELAVDMAFVGDVVGFLRSTL